MKQLTLYLYTHGVTAIPHTQHALQSVRDYALTYMSISTRKVGKRIIREPGNVFATHTKDRTEFKFVSGQYAGLIQAVTSSGIPESMIDIVRVPIYEPSKVELTFKEFTPRPNQVPLISFIKDAGHLKGLTLETGGGKTMTSLKAAQELGNRIFIQVLGRFVDQWVKNVVECFPNLVLGKDILLLDSTAKFLKYIESFPKMENKPRIIIVTVSIFKKYVDHYRTTKFQDAPMLPKPEKLYEYLDIGTKIVDELHMHFHCNFLIQTMTHVPKLICLTATLLSKCPVQHRAYAVCLPHQHRKDGGALNKYNTVIAVSYGFLDHKHRKFDRMGSYSHVLYEEFLFKNPTMLKNYFTMANTLVTMEYVIRRQVGQKCLIFAARVATCEWLAKEFKKVHPSLKVVSYTSEDDISITDDADIIISTLGSTGTGIDIKGLITVLLTVSLSEPKANVQALGRLREIPGVATTFLYIYNIHVKKQVSYHRDKLDLLKPRVKSIATRQYTDNI